MPAPVLVVSDTDGTELMDEYEVHHCCSASTEGDAVMAIEVKAFNALASSDDGIDVVRPSLGVHPRRVRDPEERCSPRYWAVSPPTSKA